MTNNTTPMSDSQDSKESQEDKKGGVAWELSEAIRLMGEAVASGDPEQIATAMRRHAEALTNSANEILIPTLKSVLESVVRKEVGVLSTRLDNSDRARLKRNTEFQIELQERLDGHAQVLDAEVRTIAASVEGAALLAGKAYALAEQVEAGHLELVGRVSDLDEGFNALTDRVAIVEQTPGTYPDLLAGMQRMELSVSLMQKEYNRRLMYLLIGFGSFVFLFIALILLQ